MEIKSHKKKNKYMKNKQMYDIIKLLNTSKRRLN